MGKFKISPRMYAALYLKTKSASEVADYATDIVSEMDTAVAVFPSPTPSLTTVTDAVTDLRDTINEANTGNKVAKQQVLEKRYVLETMLVELSFYVMGIANLDPLTAKSVIEMSGMSARKSPEKSPVPESVTKLMTVFTNVAHTLGLKWKTAKYSRFYRVYMTTTPNDADSWTLVDTVSTRKTIITDLTSGQRYWFRVVSVGVNGISAPTADVNGFAA